MLTALSFENGYFVDVGLPIDTRRAGARLAEIDIGSLENDSQHQLDVTSMAHEVSRVICTWARAAGRLHMEQTVAMHETQRQATATLDHILSRRRGRTRMILLVMDGTITPDCDVLELARATRHEAALAKLPDGGDGAAMRSERTAVLFKCVHQQQIDAEVCADPLRHNPAFQSPDGDPGPPLCKRPVTRRLRGDKTEPPLAECWAMGDNVNDLGIPQTADRASVIEPKSPLLLGVPGVTVVTRFDERHAHLPEPLAAA